MKHATPFKNRTRQRGATLIIALVLLVVMLMLGISGSQNSALQERMASGSRNRELAFEAAEAALAAAGDSLTKTTLTLANTCMDSDCTHDNDTAWWANKSWDFETCKNPTSPNTIACEKFAAATLGKVASQPLYYVERLADSSDASANYRVTARGVGQDDTAIVILQAVYNIP